MTARYLPAHAWRYAADLLRAECLRDADCDVEPELSQYVLDHVVPSLLRRSEIIARNRPKRRAKP